MSDRVVRLYLVLGAVACFLFAVQFAAVAAPLIETDEGPHVAYGASLAGGVLPTIETPLPQDPGTLPGEFLQHRNFRDVAHSTIWVANHPPGFYLVTVPVVWLSNASGQVGIGLLMLRVLNAACYASLVVFAGLIARELLPSRPFAVFVAAGVQMAMSALTFDAGAVYNDGMSAALGVGALLLAIRCLRRGPDVRRVVVMAAVCTGAVLTRSPGIVVTVLCAAAVALAAMIHLPPGRRARPAIRCAIVVAGVPAAIAGWFYLRNWILYGGPTASQYLVDRFDRRQRTELLDPGFLSQFLAVQWQRLFVQRRVGSGMHAWEVAAAVVGIVVVAGLLIALAAAVVRRLRTGSWTVDRVRLIRQVAAWLLVLTYLVVTVVVVIQFLFSGANSHERYFLPVAPILAAIATAGLFGWTSHAVRRAVFDRLLAGAAVLFFISWAVLIQFPTAQWSAARADNARLGGPIGGTVLPIVAQAGATAAAIAAVVVALRAIRDRSRPSPAKPAIRMRSEDDAKPFAATPARPAPG